MGRSFMSTVKDEKKVEKKKLFGLQLKKKHQKKCMDVKF